MDWLAPPIHEACADDHCCQLQQRFLDIQPSLKADSQFAKACKLSVHPLLLEAMLAQSLATLNASPGNAAGDAPFSHMRTATLVVIVFVGMRTLSSIKCAPSRHPKRKAIEIDPRVATLLHRCKKQLLAVAVQLQVSGKKKIPYRGFDWKIQLDD